MPPEGVAQITDGLVDLTIACCSEIVLGPGDFALYVDTSGKQILSGVATIDTTPIELVAAQESRSVGPHAVPAPTIDLLGRPIPRSR